MTYLGRGERAIYYESQGSGFPLLLLPLLGMNATTEAWHVASFNPVEIFSREYWTITLDQPNAGRSTAPLNMEDPWGGYAEHQLNLMNHLGCERFAVLGHCMGCSYALRLLAEAGDRIAAAVLVSPIGVSEENKHVLKDNLSLRWARSLAERRPDLAEADIEAYRERMFSGDFVYSVSRDFVRSCTTPLLVMPAEVGNLDHPNEIGKEIAALAPNGELLENWRNPSSVTPATVRHIREFLRAHIPNTGPS